MMKTFKQYFSEAESFQRCTNFCLEPLGIKSPAPIFNMISVRHELITKGLAVLDLGGLLDPESIYSAGSRHQDPLGGGGLVGPYDLTKIRKKFPKFKFGITLNKLIPMFPKGKYIIGTRDHAMSLINGKLYDFEFKGLNKRKVNIFNQILTKAQWKSFAKKYVLDEEDIDEII